MKHPIWFIGNAHIDPVWLWRWQEGFSEIKATFRSALDRMKEFDDFVFTCAGACYYQWVEENEPDMFEEIRARVKEGRWVIAGGWWLQPDCNAPCGESFARHALYSQAYYRRAFGTQAKFGYNVDSFGHNGNLPQILSLSGMPRYVMMRPMEHEKALNAHAFKWRGVDGTTIPVFRIPHAYCTGWDEDLDGLLDALRRHVDEADEPEMFFYGVGNHGGGPTVKQLRTISAWMKDDPDLRFGQPGDFFAKVQDGVGLHRTVEGDLQHHAIGCYSARSEIKKNNRRAENRLLAAEKLAAAARRVIGLVDPRDKLRRAWEDVMFNQFHDIMGGCAIRAAYDDARDQHGEALRLAGETLNAAAQRISWHVDTLGGRDLSVGQEGSWAEWEKHVGGYPVVVFNPNAFEAAVCVKLTRALTGALDERGDPLPFQNLRSDKTVNERGRDEEGVVALTLPPLGYRTISIWRSAKPEKAYASSGRYLKAGGCFIENDWFRLELDRATGEISRLFDKTRGREVFAGHAARGEVIEDYQNDTWAHGKNELTGTIGFFGDGRLTLREWGEVCAVLRAQSCFGTSTLIQDFTLYRDRPDIDVHVTVNWQESFRILKLSFPLNGDNTRAVYEIPYASIEKDADGQEEPGQSWAAVRGEKDGAPVSVAVVNDSSYSYSVAGNILRFVAVRSAGAADHFGIKDEFTQVTDIGVHELNYSIVPGGAPDKAALTRRAALMNQPPFPVYETFHAGPLPLSASYAAVEGEGVLLNVVKDAEEGDGLVIRAVETSGRPARARVSLPFIGASVEADYRPFEIKTFRVGADGSAAEVDLLERPIDGE
ncbi:MAG: alpha-mannosidase [Clostridia bacterium]|nr:alpha-mannosidase [Clostridia bacterium]